jgi:tripartite-type tricarboxylate transporter receptor subunit TctC
MIRDTRLSRRSILAASGLMAAGATLARPALAQGRYPSRPIQMVVPWGAGGGTDATARIVGSLLERDLGQPVNVVNRTGGSGVVGHQAIAGAAPDGHTIGMITVEITMMHWQGLTELRPTSYTPLALMNSDPPGVTVNNNARWQNIQQLADAIKASQPGQLKASGTGQGGIWHLALAGMLNSNRIDPMASPWVPSQGAAPGLNDLVAGGVELVTCSLPEARALIEAGKVRPLAIMADQPAKLFPNVPTLKSATGSNWTVGAWRGMAGPKGMPADVTAKLSAAFKKIYDSKDFQDFMNQRGFGLMYLPPDQQATFMDQGSKGMGEVMKAVGLVK